MITKDYHVSLRLLVVILVYNKLQRKKTYKTSFGYKYLASFRQTSAPVLNKTEFFKAVLNA